MNTLRIISLIIGSKHYASPSSNVSGSFFPRVSGKMAQRPAPIRGTMPKARGGSHGLVLDRVATNGAIMDPILATVEDSPTPEFLTTVGNSSPAYRYTVAKDMLMPHRPMQPRARWLAPDCGTIMMSKQLTPATQLELISVSFLPKSLLAYIETNVPGI